MASTASRSWSPAQSKQHASRAFGDANQSRQLCFRKPPRTLDPPAVGKLNVNCPPSRWGPPPLSITTRGRRACLCGLPHAPAASNRRLLAVCCAADKLRRDNPLRLYSSSMRRICCDLSVSPMPHLGPFISALQYGFAVRLRYRSASYLRVRQRGSRSIC